MCLARAPWGPGQTSLHRFQALFEDRRDTWSQWQRLGQQAADTADLLLGQPDGVAGTSSARSARTPLNRFHAHVDIYTPEIPKKQEIILDLSDPWRYIYGQEDEMTITR